MALKTKIFIFIGFITSVFISSYLIIQVVRPKPPTLSIIHTDPRQNALFESEAILEPSYLVQSHSASIQALADGSLIAVWFAGSHEAKHDVQIWQSIYTNGHWSPARAIVSATSLSRDSHSFVFLVGNPVVYRANNNVLYLFVVSVGLGGWALSSINQLYSTNMGKSWHKARRLFISPFFNRSNLVRSNAITLNDGGFYLPIYHELIYNYPQLLRFDATGKLLYSQRLNDNLNLLQPSIVSLSPKHIDAFFRNSAKHNTHLYLQQSFDAGQTWGKLIQTNLTNQDSSIAVIKTSYDQLLMVHNNELWQQIGANRHKMNIGRGQLELVTSKDGVTWRHLINLESHAQGEYAYPSIIKDAGVFDLVYTYNRKYIKHVRFNLAWLNSLSAQVVESK